MTDDEIVEVLETELKCVKKAEFCDRDCANCELILPVDQIIEAYTVAISKLRRGKL